MSESLFSRYAEQVRAGYAEGLACEESAFSDEQLTVVDRPEPPAWPYTAMAVTFGTGTVLSIDPVYRSFAEANLPEKHYRAAHPELLERIAEEARNRGATVSAVAPALGFALAHVPPPPPIPRGLALREVNQAWMAAEQRSGRFENGVGKLERAARALRNEYAAVLFEGDTPVAVGGVFLTFGMQEIGVDVVRSHRGKGLGKAVVTAAARLILEREGLPFYACAATNIRSQRTALASGFLPVCSDSFVA